MDQKAGTSALKPILGFRDLVLFYLVAIFGVRLLPNAASAGPSIIFIIALVLIIYFIPLGLTVSNLSMRYPEEGGIYIWTKTAFGDFHGYITAWTYWTANLAFFPSMLLFTSSQLASIIPAFGFLGQNQVFLAITSILLISLVLLLNIIGLKSSTILNNISGITRFITVGFIIIVGIISFAQFGSATNLEFSNWIPRVNSIKDLIFISTVVYLFAGLEGGSIIGEEIHNARKNIPRAIVASGFLITIMYILASLSLIVAIPSEQLTALQGFTDSVHISTFRLGGEGFAEFSTSLVSLFLVIISLGGISVWLAASARLPFVVGLDSYLPPSFGKLHKKYNTPYISLISLVTVTVFFIILSSLGGKAEQAYQILISLEIVIFLIPNLYMFAAAIKIEWSNRFKKKVNLPGGSTNAIAAGILGLTITLIATILALVPGEEVDDPVNFYITVGGSLFFNLAVGIGIYLWAKRKY
jgi:glutamate:GABA antiporter